MTQNQIQITVLEASEGMTLTNGKTYSKKVYLGIYDSPENWHEINDEDVPEEDGESIEWLYWTISDWSEGGKILKIDANIYDLNGAKYFFGLNLGANSSIG